jgi:hypothetical protein
MRWSITLHPAVMQDLSEDKATLDASPELPDFIEQLLDLQFDGGHRGTNPGFPQSLSNKTNDYWHYRFNICHADRVIALGGKWTEATAAVVAIGPASLVNDEAAFRAFGEKAGTRYKELQADKADPLTLSEALSWFPVDAVIVAEATVQKKMLREGYLDIIRAAHKEMLKDITDLYNLGETQTRRVERKADFLIETLRSKLTPLGATVSLNITFKDGSTFTTPGLAGLERL